MADPNKKYKIMIAGARRIHKEYASYVEELEFQQADLIKLQQPGEDAYKAKKQQEIIEETKTMLPNVILRLTAQIEQMELIKDEIPDEEIKEECTNTIQEMKEFIQEIQAQN